MGIHSVPEQRDALCKENRRASALTLLRVKKCPGSHYEPLEKMSILCVLSPEPWAFPYFMGIEILSLVKQSNPLFQGVSV